jgi:predicted nucleotidyltransferase
MSQVILEPTFENVEKALARIVATVHPSRIIAFGSRARGVHAIDSDLDLLVVLAGDRDYRGLAGDLYHAVGALGFSKDFVLSNEARLEQLQHHNNSVEAEAVREGITLYENGRTDRAALTQVCR